MASTGIRRIDRLDPADRTRFAERYRLQQPVVLPQGTRSWPHDLFDLEGLASRFGSVPVITYRMPEGAQRMVSVQEDFYFWTDRDAGRRHLRRWRFGEFLEALRRDEPHYCMANRTKNRGLRDLLAARLGPFDVLPLSRERPGPGDCEFFFGSRGSGPGLHHDGAIESFLCQLAGRKRIQVFDPADVAYLYPARPWTAPMGHFSLVRNSFEVDLRRFPLFARARPWRCRLEAGDVLYLPPHWYHDPSADGPSAMLTVRVVPPVKDWGREAARERVARAARSLYDALRPFSPAARATYAALVHRDMTERPSTPNRAGKTAKVRRRFGR